MNICHNIIDYDGNKSSNIISNQITENVLIGTIYKELKARNSVRYFTKYLSICMGCCQNVCFYVLPFISCNAPHLFSQVLDDFKESKKSGPQISTANAYTLENNICSEVYFYKS